MRKAIILVLLLFLCISAYCRSQESRDDEICLKCHKETFEPPKKYQHPLVRQGKCKACHSLYDTAAHSERIKPTLEACLDCHPEQELGRSHPVGGGIIDPNTGDTMTCVSTCHLPHGSDYKYQTPFKNNMDLCTSCHKEF